MHNIEEKGTVSSNGIGISNGLSNKETDDTWADLNNAIDDEINGCSEDPSTKNIICDNGSANISSVTPVTEQNISKLHNNKSESIVIDLECSDKESDDNAKRGDKESSSDQKGENGEQKALTADKNADPKIINGVQKDSLSKQNSSKDTSEEKDAIDKCNQLSTLNGVDQDKLPKNGDSDKSKKEELGTTNGFNKDIKKDTDIMLDSDNVKSEKVKSEGMKLEPDSKEDPSKITHGTSNNVIEGLNYDSALQELSDITKYAKVLDDDHTSSIGSSPSSSTSTDPTNKRKLSNEPLDNSPTSLKRTKVEEDKISTEIQATTKAIKKQLKRISRTEMEDLVARKVVEVISCRSEIGDLRAKCDKYEEMNDKWKRKTQALQKMCQDLNTVIKRYILDVKNKKDNPTPIKITRSVGLQVCADSRRRVPIHPQQTQASAQLPKQAASQKISSTTSSTQRRVINGNQTSNVIKASLPHSSSSLPSGTVSAPTNDGLDKTSKPLQNVLISPTTTIMSNAGHRLMQSSPQHPLINKSPVNNQKGAPSVVPSATISSNTKGYLATQAVILQAAPTALVTAAPSQINNSSYIRSTLPIASPSPGLGQQASVSSSATSNTLSNAATANKTPAANTSALATATAASNKVIDLVELSDEEDTIPTPPPPTQPKSSVPVQRSQQQSNVNNRNAVNSNAVFQNQLPQHKPQQVVNRIHAPNTSRPAGSGSGGSGGGIRPMVFANQMANGVNVHRQPPLVNHRIVPPSHPAQLPEMPNPQPHAPSWKKLPPRPTLKISRLKSGIVLSWNMDVIPTEHAAVASYQIYAYQEGSAAPQSGLWKKVGDVKALPLPMACTLTQFTKGNKYHFAVRAQDVHSRVGSYSDPQSIALT